MLDHPPEWIKAQTTRPFPATNGRSPQHCWYSALLEKSTSPLRAQPTQLPPTQITQHCSVDTMKFRCLIQGRFAEVFLEMGHCNYFTHSEFSFRLVELRPHRLRGLTMILFPAVPPRTLSQYYERRWDPSRCHRSLSVLPRVLL
jgi:hypothetical protein